MAMANSVEAVKSSVYSVQLSLLEGISVEEKLHAAGKVLTQSEYADVVTERSIVNMCGYPLCGHSLPSTFHHKGRFRISLREHKVYDVQETRLFCSSDCLVLSKAFAASLPPDRDYSIKTLELAATFHNLPLQDVDYQQVRSLSMEDVLAHKQESKQESHQGTRMEECLEDTSTSGHKQEFDLLGPDKDTATQQNLLLKSDTFLLIREQDEIKVDEFGMAGPSDAIEGYVPQKEYRSSPHKQDIDQDKTKQVQPSGLDSKDRSGISSKRKQKNKNKATTSSKFKEARRASFDMQPEFTSCILVEQGQPATLSDMNCKDDLAGNRTKSIEGPMPHAVMGEQVSMQNMGRQLAKKQNRVSWADHNNLNLVEDLSSLAAACGSPTLIDVCNFRCSPVEGDQAVIPSSFTSREVDAAVEGSSELLQRQENSDYGEGPGKIQGIDYRHENLESAKALVAALTEAADAVAHGEIDSSEAVERAGISILSGHEEVSVSPPLIHFLEERKDLEKDSPDEVENIDPRECWYSAPPKDFKPELSAFGTLWMALDGWISAASIAHVYGKDSDEENEFAFINGKEYLRQVIMSNGISAEIERTIAGCISRALPGLIEALRFPVPVSTLEVSLGRFLRTMTFVSAIPPLSSKQWQVVVLLLLDALSVHRLPALRTRFLNGRQLFQKVLTSANVTEAEYEIFRDLVLPMGMLPDFAARCGG